jgi:ABC-2 type transport system permease protein
LNLHRILAVFQKDVQWGTKNLKLLTIICMPLLISVGLTKLLSGHLSSYTLVFSISFVGLFLTSYIIAEEKRLGTLKTILISPLTPHELVLGKFLLPLCLCLLFSFLVFVSSNNLKIFFSPPVFAAIVLMSASICLLGTLFGLFFKNEQELGVSLPIIFFPFIFGEVIHKATGANISGFFPDYHLSHLVDNYFKLSDQQILMHLFSIGIFFSVLLSMTAQYIRFFFSKDTDGHRINLKTLLFLPAVALFLIASGLSQSHFKPKASLDSNKKLSTQPIDTPNWTGAILYDSSVFEVTDSKGNKSTAIEYFATEPEPFKISTVFLMLDENTSTLEKRIEHAKELGTYFINISTMENKDWNKRISANQFKYVTNYEKQCGNEILSVSFEHPKKSQLYSIVEKFAEQLITQSTLNCRKEVP